MEILSERISVVKKDDVFSVVILPSRDRKKLFLMFLWLFAWTVCGVIVGANFFQAPSRESKLFIVVYMSFWLYFEVSILRTYIWRRYGREKIWISKGLLHYQRETNGRGRIKSYHVEFVSPLEVVEVRQTNILDSLSQSFWMRGGERLETSIQGKPLRIGMQLNDEEARQLRRELNQALKA
jgi:hypothetical protein